MHKALSSTEKKIGFSDASLGCRYLKACAEVEAFLCQVDHFQDCAGIDRRPLFPSEGTSPWTLYVLTWSSPRSARARGCLTEANPLVAYIKSHLASLTSCIEVKKCTTCQKAREPRNSFWKGEVMTKA